MVYQYIMQWTRIRELLTLINAGFLNTSPLLVDPAGKRIGGMAAYFLPLGVIYGASKV